MPFVLYNKLEQGIKINWDDVSLAINGKAQRVLHGETGETKLNDIQPPTTIPPHSKLEDFLVCRSNVHVYSGAYGTSSTFDEMFPKLNYNKKQAASAMLLKGERISIYMPIYIDNTLISKYYNIEITDVVQSK